MDYAEFLRQCRTAVSPGVYETLATLTVSADRGPFLSQWAEFYQSLSRELTYQRSVKLGRPCPAPYNRDPGIVRAVSEAVQGKILLPGVKLSAFAPRGF